VSALRDVHPWPRRGELPYKIKRTGVLIRNFEKNPKRYQNPALWAWLEMFLTPERYQF